MLCNKKGENFSYPTTEWVAAYYSQCSRKFFFPQRQHEHGMERTALVSVGPICMSFFVHVQLYLYHFVQSELRRRANKGNFSAGVNGWWVTTVLRALLLHNGLEYSDTTTSTTGSCWIWVERGAFAEWACFMSKSRISSGSQWLVSIILTWSVQRNPGKLGHSVGIQMRYCIPLLWTISSCSDLPVTHSLSWVDERGDA